VLDRYFSDRRTELLKLDGGATVPLRFTDAHAEHLATRSAAGLFDFSFMGRYEVRGAGARAFLDRVQTRRLSRLAGGRLFYTLLLQDDGSVLNDATLWEHGPEHYWLFTGRRSDFAWLERQCRGDAVELADQSAANAVLALQGPRSAEILQRVPGASPGDLPYFHFGPARLAGVEAWIGRLGYSGELGYEIIVPAVAGAGLWRELLAAGRDAGLLECGFAAADSLRIESGHILFNRELGPGIDPFALGMERLLDLHGREFTGAAALRGRRRQPPRRRLAGIVPSARRGGGSPALPRAQVTSEAYSPVHGRSLALGFVDADGLAPGSALLLADGRHARSARLPFYDPGRVLPRRG